MFIVYFEVENVKNKTVCFTGHRKISMLEAEYIRPRLENLLTQFINDGYLYFGVGGALGFDTIAAKTIIHLKTIYPKIKLILVLPCPAYSEQWNDFDQSESKNIKTHADKIVYMSKEYSLQSIFARNRHLVDNSSVCICYLTKTNGGTFYTVNYAKEKQLRIFNIADQK